MCQKDGTEIEIQKHFRGIEPPYFVTTLSLQEFSFLTGD